MTKISLIEPVGGHGGMDYYDYGLAQGVGAHNAQVILYTSSKTNVRNYNNVKTKKVFEKVWESNSSIRKLFYYIKGLFRALFDSKSEKSDVIHYQFFELGKREFITMLISKISRKPKVLTLHDISSFKGTDVNFLEKWILKQFQKIIVHNELSKGELKLKKYSENSIEIIPHGNYLPFVKELTYNPNQNSTLKILFFGQIKKVKGLDVLLKSLALAIKKGADIQLTIAGKPWHDSVDVYTNLISELGIQKNVITNFSFIPDEDVSNYFEETDVVVLPYRKIYQSGVLLLSMSYGRVVLTSDIPAFLEIIENSNTGFTFESENIESLSSVLLDIQKNKSTLQQIKENSSSLLKEKFDWKIIGKQTLELYKSVI